MRHRFALLVLGTLISSAALAANVHFKRGPTITENEDTVTVRACLAGLGNGDITVDVAADGTAETTCTNSGGNVAPGQDSDVEWDATLLIKDEEIKNGTVCFTVTTVAPTTNATEAGCPQAEPKWTADIESVDFTSATLFVYQGGKLVLDSTVAL